MLRTFLLACPFLICYVLVAAAIFVPITWITRSIKPIYRAAQIGANAALRLAGIRLKMLHLERAFAPATAVFICNHVSNLDPPALFGTLPRIAVVLKESLGRIPVLGYVMGLGGFIYVDRGDRDSRRKAVEASVATLRQGISLLVFPEGTRSPDGKLLPFRPGPFSMAIEAQVPVVPITVHGSRRLMPKGRNWAQPGEVTLHFHEPIPTTGLTTQDRAELMARARSTMERALEQMEA
jgi:1-acyl-sn-glycerol-3-phosphate acyltransferase